MYMTTLLIRTSSRPPQECPVCRRPFNAVMKNHPMDSVIEAELAINSY